MFMLVVAFAIAAPFLKDMRFSRVTASPKLKIFYPIGLVPDQSDTIYQQLPSYVLSNQFGDSLSWKKGDTLDQIRLFGLAGDSSNFVQRNKAVIEMIDSISSGENVIQFLTIKLPHITNQIPQQEGIEILNGDPERINIIARNGLKLKWDEATGQQDLKLILIDRLGFTRGMYKIDELGRLKKELGILWNGHKGF